MEFLALNGTSVLHLVCLGLRYYYSKEARKTVRARCSKTVFSRPCRVLVHRTQSSHDCTYKTCTRSSQRDPSMDGEGLLTSQSYLRSYWQLSQLSVEWIFFILSRGNLILCDISRSLETDTQLLNFDMQKEKF